MVAGFALALGVFVISGATSNTKAEVIEIDGEGEQKISTKKKLMRAVHHDTHHANLDESEHSQESTANDDFHHADEAWNEHAGVSHAFEEQGNAPRGAGKRTRRVLLENHHANHGSSEVHQEKVLSEAFPHRHDARRDKELAHEDVNPASEAEQQGKASLAQQSDQDQLEELDEDELDSLDALEDRISENGQWIHHIVNAFRRRKWWTFKNEDCVFLDWTYDGPCTDTCYRQGEVAQKEYRPEHGPEWFGKPCVGRHDRWVECYKTGANSVPVCPMVAKPDKATTPEPMAPFTTVGWPLCTGNCN